MGKPNTSEPNARHDNNKKGVEAMISYLKFSEVNALVGPNQGKTRGVQVMWVTLGSIMLVTMFGLLQERASP